ncbi:MAG: hypothetical protein ACXWQO_18470 [Bdellovibrionota bacterium]
MRLIVNLFVVSLLALSTAFAVEASPGELFAKKVANTENWNKFLAGFQANLNPLVLKKLTTITNDLPFPMMQVRKGKLMISNENGEHMTLMFFKKNGAVTLNGKEWVNRPLATPEAEVARIMELLNGGANVSFMDFVVPSAQAAGLGMSKSVAAAAYASSMAWKGEACKQEDTSDDLNASCMLMAVAMRSPTPINPNMPVGPHSYYATDLTCPAKKGGNMIFVMKNKAGWTALITTEYSVDRATKIKMTLAEQGKAPLTSLDTSLDAEMTPADKETAGNLKRQSDHLLREVCQGSPDDQNQFKELVLANKALFSSQASTENPISDKKSGSGL